MAGSTEVVCVCAETYMEVAAAAAKAMGQHCIYPFSATLKSLKLKLHYGCQLYSQVDDDQNCQALHFLSGLVNWTREKLPCLKSGEKACEWECA